MTLASSSIEWTDVTWNPVTGCDKVSPGCKYCYAEVMARRLKAMGQPNYINGFNVTLQHHLVTRPLEWRRPSMIFVNSMSDLLHDQVPIDFVVQLVETMRAAHWHVFQVLTKRASRLAELDALIDWPPNVWMGVSIESAAFSHRADDLRRTGARVKFLSLEPLLGPLPNLNLSGISWVIAGGESGPRSRPVDPVWIRQVRDLCCTSDVPFFFKQWGGTNKKKAGRILDGRTWDELPGAPEIILTLPHHPSAQPGTAPPR